MEKVPKSIEELVNLVKDKQNIKFKIKAIANSKNNSIEFLDEFIKIKIKEKAIDGKANKAIIEYLAEILDIAKSKIEIASGEKSTMKTISIKL